MRIFKLQNLSWPALAVFVALSATAMFGQSYDSSGNSMLNGSYRFRYVANVSYNSVGNVVETTAAEGVISFDGNGNYTITGGSQYIDNTLSGGKFQSYPTGTASTQAFAGGFALNTAGVGALDNVDPDIPSGVIINGTCTEITGSTCQVFMGSSTETGPSLESADGLVVTDLFVAILAGAPPTNSSFNSPYWIGAMDFAAGSDLDVKNALFKVSPDGNGNLGTITVNGQANSNQANALTQTITGAKYNFASDGNAQFTLPAPSGVTTAQVMVSGNRNIYVSADGNFLLGWTSNSSSTGGYDIMIGVKALTSTAKDSLFSGLYYTAGMLDQPPYQGQAGCGGQSFWGAVHADGNKNEIVHQRLWSPFCSLSSLQIDYGSDNSTAMGAAGDGTASDDLGSLYAFGVGGKAFIAISNSVGNFGLTLGVLAPNFTPTSGVFLLPWGVNNAANWDPNTASVAPGELLNLYVTGITGGAQLIPGGKPCPTTLGTVSVTIGAMPATVCDVVPYGGGYYQVTILAPFELVNSTATFAQIQVSVNGLLSNQVSVYLTDAESGFFSLNANGIGTVIAEHTTAALCTSPAPNTCLVTAGNPAQPGETITLALGGMGAVSPAVADGAIGPSNPLSYNTNFTNANQLVVLFNDYNNNSTGKQGTVAFAGLYPSFVGLYQMNVTVPTGVGPGNVYIEVVTDYADVEQVTIPVGGTAAAAASPLSEIKPLAAPGAGSTALRIRKQTRNSASQVQLQTRPQTKTLKPIARRPDSVN